jgi:hypothetical protein
MNGWQFGGGEPDSDTDFHDWRDNPPLNEDDWIKDSHSLDVGFRTAPPGDCSQEAEGVVPFSSLFNRTPV